MTNRSWGVVLLAIWLIAVGLVAVLSLTFASMQIVLGLVAVAAGILILVGR